MTSHAEVDGSSNYPREIVNERRQIVLGGVVCIALGASVCMIALNILPYEESKIHAPDWVILVSGAVFIFGGLAMLFRANQLVVSVLGNLIVLSFACVAAWVAFLGPSEHFSGGIPLLSYELNVKVARIMFGSGSVMCALILIPGVKQLLKLLRSQ